MSKAGLAATFIVTSSLMVLAQVFAGTHNGTTLAAMCIGAPAAVLGSQFGFLASRNMDEHTYRKLFFGFIACTGLNFLRQALGVPW